MAVAAFVQARMSSRRFPGKVLAPFRGQALVAHVLAAVRSGIGDGPVVLLTSTDPTDDPLAAYVAFLGFPVHRGPLDDVFARFRGAAEKYPCDFVVRVCADSPLLAPRVVSKVVAATRSDVDLVTTTHRRTFPKGMNVEAIRAETLLTVDERELDAHDREHVTAFFHRRPDRFRIVNVESGDASLAMLDYAVDTLDDLVRLEAEAIREVP